MFESLKKLLGLENRKTDYSNGLTSVVEQLGRIDSLQNLRLSGRYSLFSLDRELLTQSYGSDGIFRTIVNTQILDALRGQPRISSSQLSPENIELLDDYLLENDILETVSQFFILNNLYGGSGLLIDVLGQRFEDFFSLSSLKQGDRVKFYALDRWELASNLSGDQTRNNLSWGDYYYYGDRVNPARVMILRGIYAPVTLRQRLQGWGLSIVEPLVAPSNAYHLGVKVLYELLSEAKIDVMKISGLNNSLAAGQDGAVINRVALAGELKNFKSTLALDSEDDYQQKQLNLSGLPDLIRELKYEISSAVDMPVSKIWGIQASGFSSGNEDILKYNARVLSEVRPRCIRYLKKVLKIICKILFGIVPRDLEIEFDELTLLTQEQTELKKQNEFLRLKSLYDSSLLTSGELGELLSREGILRGDTAMLRGELPDFSLTSSDFEMETP
jgi:phage-related protein (TIGR01555 family)